MKKSVSRFASEWGLKFLEDFWANFYVQDHHCSLCGNTGIIDTSDVTTSANVQCGRKNLCICPNGLALREQGVTTESINGTHV
jgi:hypothetical protein